MNEDENEIFNLLTSSEEKFKLSFESSKYWNIVKKELIIRFWKNVEKELNTLIKESDARGKDFKASLDTDVLERYSKCYLTLNGDTKARFLYQNLAEDQFMGLWIDNLKVNHQRIKKYVNDSVLEFPHLSKSAWWISVVEVNENFGDFDSLLKILPEKAEEYSKRKAKDLFDFAVENEDHLKAIIS